MISFPVNCLPRTEKAVKFAREGYSRVTLTEADEGILKLKTTLLSLEKQEIKLNEHIDRFACLKLSTLKICV